MSVPSPPRPPRPSLPCAVLLLPGGVALLTGLALALRWESAVLLLFMVGLYPLLAACVALALWLAHVGLQAPRRPALLGLAGIVLAWVVLLLCALWWPWRTGAAPSREAVMAGASLVAGVAALLVATVHCRGARHGIALAAALAAHLLLYVQLDRTHPVDGPQAELVAIQQRLTEVTGTLAWQTEAPALTQRRERAQASLAQAWAERWRAFERVPAVPGAVALALALVSRRRWPVVAFGLALFGGLCLLLSFSYLATAAPR